MMQDDALVGAARMLGGQKSGCSSHVRQHQTKFVSLLACVSTLCTSSALSQITDKEQAKRWIGLQRLAIRAIEIERCETIAAVRSTTPNADLLRASAGDVAEAVEEYIALYQDRRFKYESASAFRFRVWKITIKTGIEGARSLVDLSARDNCAALRTGKSPDVTGEDHD